MGTLQIKKIILPCFPQFLRKQFYSVLAFCKTNLFFVVVVVLFFYFRIGYQYYLVCDTSLSLQINQELGDQCLIFY